MAFSTLLPQVGTVTTGTATLFSTSDSRRNLQFNPQPGVGFSGTVVIEGSSAGQPGSGDWVQLAEVVFSAHTQNVSLDFFTDQPWMRAKTSAVSSGAVAVFASN